MKNLTCFFLCAFLAFGLSSCNKSNDVDNSVKETPFRLHESVTTEAGLERSKSIYFYDSKDRLIRVQLQEKTAGIWKNISEIIYTYSGSKVTVTRASVFVHTYTLSKGRVTKYVATKSSDDEEALYVYNAAGDLISLTEDGTPYTVSYDSDNRFSSFSASFSGLGETISMVGTASYVDNKMSKLSVVKSISDKKIINATNDYSYSWGLLISESNLSYDDDTEAMETIPTVINYNYDPNKCLISLAITSGGVVDIKYDYTYEEGEGNAALFEYLPSQLLVKKWTGGMIK